MNIHIYNKELHTACEQDLVELSKELATCRRIEADLQKRWQAIYEIKHIQDKLLIEQIKQVIPSRMKAPSQRAIKKVEDFTPAERDKLLKELKEMQNA